MKKRNIVSGAIFIVEFKDGKSQNYTEFEYANMRDRLEKFGGLVSIHNAHGDFYFDDLKRLENVEVR
jgi:hypothetical protein